MCRIGSSVVLSLLALAALAVCANSQQEQNQLGEVVNKRSADDGLAPEELGILDDDVEDEELMDKRSRLFRYGRGGLMRYGKRAPGVFRYGKRGVFRYGKRSDEEEGADLTSDQIEGVKRLFRWGKRSDDDQEDVKRLFRWGKRSGLEDDEDKRGVFRYGKRESEDAKRRVFRFGKRADYGDYKYGRDTRVPDQPHVPFRFGDE